ncbi:MAG: peptidase domain-containing ABC transporter [Sphingomonas sp.]|uniref:peptidase domain-containing ABC transporter n=1 Tax=Sphingomonas sp. TaxID=28214 RepID=UPI0025FCBDBB|nr:peptidase domain-containing ABC transporter [Sphingomonas sp.]MBQ1498950.1 peptidase domain-containing ABC transporter [Sphingomonas sp.]
MSIELLQLGGARRTPLIAQSEASECALACLAMIAGHHGFKTDLIELRQRFALSLKGATLKQLMLVAEAIGFNARPLRGEIEELGQLKLPAILHWNLNHFVVLTRISDGVGGRRYHVHDPARGALTLGREEMSRSFTGVAIELLQAESFKPKQSAPPLRIGQLWSSMTGFWQAMRNVILLSLVLQLAVLASPFFLQVSIDTVFPASDRDLLGVLALGFAGVAIVSFLASWLRAVILVNLGNALSYQVVINLFRHLMRLPLPWFEKRHVGDVIQRFSSTAPITSLLSQGLIAGLVDGVMGLLTLILMFVYSPILGAIAIVALGLYVVVRLLFLKAMQLRNIDAISTAARENSVFIESVRGIAAIKAFGREGERQRLWQQSKADAVNAQIRLGRLTAGFDAIGKLVLDLEGVLFVLVAITLALDAKLTLGMIFAFSAYKQQFLGAGMRLVEQGLNLKIVQVHLARIADIALTPKEDDRIGDAPDFSQPIAAHNLWYRYGMGEPDVLKGASIQIDPGEMIAIVGPSGGGKTTLMKILMGLFDANHGTIQVGGRSITTFGKQAYRQSIGSVAQDDALYAGSLAQNIAFFDNDIDMERVEDAARRACIHDDIKRMPLGYDTLVGDMGSVLSGGQKQRVLLARALYGQPKILFIDEGTAHLDPETEAKVLASLSALNITRVMIAHRTQSIAAAHRVYMVADGRVLLMAGDGEQPALQAVAGE